MAGLYIHIPFCKQACHYCDFHFSTNQQVKQELVLALGKELILQQHYLKREPIHTIYFGGGTPSLLTRDELAYLLEIIETHYKIDAKVEITLEANPDDLDENKLAAIHAIGINRLSIGIQSFDNTLLKFLNRAHDSTNAINSFQLARQAGFENISVDLIFGIPGQSDTTLHTDVQQMLALNPDHVSCYSLTIEEKTVFGKWSKTGKIKSVDDDVAAGHLEYISYTLMMNGFEHYEVSNFSKPGFQSKHNTSYWKRQPYLGIGPSAHSFNLHSRQYNISNNHRYISSIGKGEIPCEVEILSKEDQINEYILTTLRASWGCDLTVLQKDFDYNLLEDRSEYIATLLSSNLAVTTNTHLVLTKKGRLLADKISSDLFLLTT